MRKVSEEVVRFNCRLPKAIADWLGENAKRNGVTLSEQVRHTLIEVKSGEDFVESFALKGAKNIMEKALSV